MLRLQVRTNERRSVIAARLQASVLRGSLARVDGGETFATTSASLATDAVARKIAESDQAFFPRLRQFLEENPFCDTVVLLQRSFDAPSFQETKRRLLQSYHGLVPLIHYHHGTLSVVLKEFGMKSIDEIAAELTGELHHLRSPQGPRRKDSATAPSSQSITSLPSVEPAKPELVDRHSTMVKSTPTSSDTTIVSPYLKEQEEMRMDRGFSAHSRPDRRLLAGEINPTAAATKDVHEGKAEAGRSSDGLPPSEAGIGIRKPQEQPRDQTQQPHPFFPASSSLHHDTPLAAPPVLPSPTASDFPPSSRAGSTTGGGSTKSSTNSKAGIPPDGGGGSSARNGWDALLEGKRRRLMRVAYGGIAQGVIPLDPQYRQRVRVLRGKYHNQHVLLTIEWEIFFVLYFERVRSLGSTKRTLMLVHPVLCGFTPMLAEEDAAASNVGDSKRKKSEAALGKRLVIRIERPYSPDEVGVSEEVLMRQLNTNMQQLMGSGKTKKGLPAGGDVETSSNVSGAENKEVRDQLLNRFQLSLTLEIDSESRRDAAAAVKTLNGSVRRATEALYKSMLAANVSGGPMINGADANAIFPKPLATMPTVP
ncbi:unnamed protein product [Phytomonas sp. EM1]|nr:unnamed protein product [Phytomonas sp. EM1]|eukprot:CCW65107.1 unnamed protein product [Phytomonas sp. isolate EM1]